VLVTRQNGMNIAMSRGGNGQLPAMSYRYFADVADDLKVEEVRSSNTIVRREPLGVAGVIVPWNGPQALLAWKLGPALAAGCTVVLAPRSRYEEVVSMVADAMSSVPMGDPMDPDNVFGPLVAERQRDRVEGYIKLGLEEGAKLVVGGGRPIDHPTGYYVEPTV